MEIVTITYDSGLPAEAVDALFRERAGKYREMDGLLQKFYTVDEERGRVGGVYVFETAAARDALFDSDVHASLREAYDARDVEIDSAHVLFPLHEAAEFPASS